MFMTIIHALPHLSHLMHLRLSISCDDCKKDIDRNLILNNIWNLPRLIYCDLLLFNYDTNYICSLTKQSTSIQNLHLHGFISKYNGIDLLLNHTPNLKYLNVQMQMSIHNNYAPSFSSSKLFSLKIDIYLHQNSLPLFLFLKALPNLRRLDVSMDSIEINGYQWEQLIRNYLPKLKQFTLSIVKFLRRLPRNVQPIMDQLVTSFQTPFWIDEHKWYVQCIKYGCYMHLYTLPSNICGYQSELPHLWYSTKPDDRLEDFHANMSHVHCDRLFRQILPPTLCLSNINHLNTRLPLPDQFWSIIPYLDKLLSLRLVLDINTSTSDIQTLFDCAPNLHSLYIQSLNTSVFTCTHRSIHALSFTNYRFCAEDCLKLVQSSLSQQCQCLLIELEHQQDVLILIEKMPNLRSLKVKFDPLHDKIEMVTWLKNQISKTCFVSSASDLTHGIIIQIWIK